MSEFKREERFIVVKLKTMDAYQKRCMRDFLGALEIRTCECVVVESDWPEYETVWSMLAARVEGRPAPYQLLEQQVAALRQHKTDYMEAAEGTRKALQEEVAALRARVVVVPDDLLQRCREVLDWQKTGTLKGRALRNLGHARWPDDPNELHLAENETARGAYRFIDELARLNGKAVSEGLLRRVTIQPPAVCDIEEQWKWQREHDQALDELRALLGEGKES